MLRLGLSRSLSGSINPMRYTTRAILIAVTLSAFIAFLVASGIRSRTRTTSESQQALVALLVCDYLLANTNQWPTGWSALEPIFVARYQKSSPWKFDDLKSNIALRFDIDGPSLAGVALDDIKSQSFIAIEPKSGQHEYREVDPNQIILNHFRNMISH